MSENIEMRKAYVETLIDLATKDERVVVLDADLMKAHGTGAFKDRFPDRYFDVGIAEANMIGIAAGLSAEGFIPFVASFGTFATRRCLDQAVLSNAYAGLNVKIMGSDPGVTAELNGGTHMPTEDIALMRAIPSYTVVEPVDSPSIRSLIPQIKDEKGPAYIRMARKLTDRVYEEGINLRLGKAQIIKEGTDATIIASGVELAESLKAWSRLKELGINVSVINMHTIKPIDKEAIIEAAKKTGAIVTAENHNIIGGLGSAVSEVLSENIPTPLRRIGYRDEFGEVGKMDYLMERFHLKDSDIVEAVKEAMSMKEGRSC